VRLYGPPAATVADGLENVVHTRRHNRFRVNGADNFDPPFLSLAPALGPCCSPRLGSRVRLADPLLGKNMVPHCATHHPCIFFFFAVVASTEFCPLSACRFLVEVRQQIFASGVELFARHCAGYESSHLLKFPSSISPFRAVIMIAGFPLFAPWRLSENQEGLYFSLGFVPHWNVIHAPWGLAGFTHLPIAALAESRISYRSAFSNTSGGGVRKLSTAGHLTEPIPGSNTALFYPVLNILAMFVSPCANWQWTLPFLLGGGGARPIAFSWNGSLRIFGFLLRKRADGAGLSVHLGYSREHVPGCVFDQFCLNVAWNSCWPPLFRASIPRRHSVGTYQSVFCELFASGDE